MTVTEDHARSLFVAAGLVAYDADVLPDALAELAVRLEIQGAGDLLALIVASCFGRHDNGICGACGSAIKQDPGNPHPRPKPPPPPPPPDPKGPS